MSIFGDAANVNPVTGARYVHLGDAADANLVIKFMPHTLQHLAVDSSDCLHDPLSQLWYAT
jgi:hypothetical protein